MEFALGESAVPSETVEAEPVAVGAKVKSEAAEIGVVAIHSVAQVIDSAVVLRGQTDAARHVDVRAETSARVISEALHKGSFVQKGQLLCELDPGTRASTLAEARARLTEARARVPETQARLAEAEARLQEATINLNAASKLSEGGFASETRVASAQAATRSAEAAVQSAKSGMNSAQSGIQAAEAAVDATENEISKLSIMAPFEGLLETDSAEVGTLLQPGALCATVIQLDPIKIAGFVPETEVGRVAVGALAGARLIDGQEVRGRVTFLSRSADPATRTFRVEIDVPNADLQIRDGQTAEILISAEGADAHLVPQSALTLNNDGVLGLRIVAADKSAKFVPITLLRDTARGVWVSGLPKTADVIIIGQEFVTDGVPVRAVFQEVGQ